MPKSRRGINLKDWKTNRADAGQGRLRIVGGRFKGRPIKYSGDPVTRPMKDNIREALFNLVGGWVPEKAVFDLFAGTGAIGLEALSRGASQAFMVERHIPTVRIIEENVQTLDAELPAKIQTSDSFFWVRQFLKQPENWPAEPWLVFFCPPYDFFVERSEELLKAIEGMLAAAPAGSLLVVESDHRFDSGLLPEPDQWTTRKYAPAIVSVIHKALPA